MAGTFSRLLYHVVFSTKGRAPLIDPDLRVELYPYLEGIVGRRGGWLLALGGMPDHVHLLVRLRPNMPVSDLVRRVKGGSSKWIHEQGARFSNFAWQSGYAAFSISTSNEAIVRSYIHNQENHHRRSDFDEELLALVKKHGVVAVATLRGCGDGDAR